MIKQLKKWWARVQALSQDRSPLESSSCRACDLYNAQQAAKKAAQREKQLRAGPPA